MGGGARGESGGAGDRSAGSGGTVARLAHGLERRDSLARRLHEIRSLVRNVLGTRQAGEPRGVKPMAIALAKRLIVMLHHVLITLGPGSTSLRLLISASSHNAGKAGKEAYWSALRDVVSAVGYLIVLLNVAVLIWRIVKATVAFIGLVMAPAKLAFLLWRWCIWS